MEQDFLAAHEAAETDFAGMRRFAIVNTGPSAYCIIGEWNSFDDLAAARPGMISILDTFRHMLDDLGDGLGVSDPVSGQLVLERTGASKKKATKKKPAKRAKPKAMPKKAAAKKSAKKKSAKRGKRK
jgi:hypothetical protein